MRNINTSGLLVGIMLFFGIVLHSNAQQSSPTSLLKGATNFLTGTKEDELLEPDLAFKLKVIVKGSNTVVAELIPANGYYMYKERIRFTIKDTETVKIKSIKLPSGEIKNDKFFGKMETYKNPIQAEITVDRLGQSKNFTLVAAYQGCHEKLGVCYPPIDKTVGVTLP